MTMPRFRYTLVIFLAACGSNAPAPVEDRQARKAIKVPIVASQSASQAYRVARGDTLYSIAFRYGLDFRRLAAANGIPAPYTIYPGQALVLKESSTLKAARVTPQPSKVSPPKTSTSGNAVQTKPANPKSEPKAVPNAVKRPTVPAPVAASGRQGVFEGKPVTRWRWPSSGKVVRGFSQSRHKGIDLAGQRGDAVEAVAAGKVVYAGTGILGLGELLIIKHNEVYLSAYGHNDSLLVAEGDLVKTGQRIARKGSTGTDTVKLHFEIRKAGKPIDPQRVLPKR